jgi:hypothetical protein
VQDPAKEDLTATFTVDFSGDPGMFEAFMNSDAADPRYWTFDRYTSTATLRYRRKKKGRR